MNKLLLSVALCSLMFISCNKSDQKMEKAEYSGADISGTATILRDKNTKATSLQMEAQGKWYLFAGTTVDDINFSKPVLEGEGSGTFPVNVNDSVRSYFQIVTDNGKAILSERHLPMTGGYNFRDLGGIKNNEGKYVKWGKIFRSDDLHHLTNADLNYLSSIPLTSIVDFRSGEEIIKAPDKLPASVNKDYPYSIAPGNLMAAKNLMSLSAVQLDSAMMDMNVLLVTDTACINQYKKFFTLVQSDKDIPLMYHCSAGKDRTGMATALILFSLGVDEKTILNDYMTSNIYLGDKYTEYIAKYPNLKPLFEVKPEFLQAGIEQIKKEYGTVENYLKNILGVDIDKMKQMYLY